MGCSSCLDLQIDYPMRTRSRVPDRELLSIRINAPSRLQSWGRTRRPARTDSGTGCRTSLVGPGWPPTEPAAVPPNSGIGRVDAAPAEYRPDASAGPGPSVVERVAVPQAAARSEASHWAG